MRTVLLAYQLQECRQRACRVQTVQLACLQLACRKLGCQVRRPESQACLLPACQALNSIGLLEGLHDEEPHGARTLRGGGSPADVLTP